MVHVTKSNFLTQLSDFLHHLPTSSYIAIDEEMTGISIPGGDDHDDRRPNKVELPGERYARRLKSVPERYSILQVGVALFHRNEKYNHRPSSSSSSSNNVVAGKGGEEEKEGREEDVVAIEHGVVVGGPGLGMQIDDDNDNDNGDNNNEEDEHAFMHREGMLNQDELEDVTEREEGGEGNEDGGREDDATGGANGDDDDDDNNNDIEEEEEEEGGEIQTEYTSRIYNFYLFPHAGGGGSSKKGGREMTLNPSTVKFLLDNHMDFDKVFREGVPYATVEESSYLKRRYFDKYRDAMKSESDDGDNSRPAASQATTPRGTRERVKLTMPEDIAFVARTMASLREWIDSDDASNNAAAAVAAAIANDAVANANPNEDAGGNDVANEVANFANGGIDGPPPPNGAVRVEPRRGGEGTSLVLPPCNAYLRRCLYETIEDEYPGLILERADMKGGGDGGVESTATLRNQIRAIRLSPSERERRESRLRREAWDEVLMEMGFATVFRAISDACNGNAFDEKRTSDFLDGSCPDLSVPPSPTGVGGGIPLVVHNGLHDLMFLLTHCHGPTLPDSFEDTKAIIRTYFPLVYDTKVIGTEFSDAIIKGGSTNLGDLFGTVCGNGEPTDGSSPPSCEIPAVITNMDGRGQGEAHEAAWDAHMTGCVFGALCNRIIESERFLESKNMTLDILLHNSPRSLLRKLVGLNLIYMHLSLYTIDLESTLGPTSGLNDPLSCGLSIDTTFHVSGITASVSTRDILRALWSGNEGEEAAIRQLKYELIWVDDSSFFVGTRLADDGVILACDPPPTGLIASHVRNKLYGGLGNKVQILSLGEYFSKKNKAVVASDASGIVGSIVSVASALINRALGFREKRSSDDNCSSGRENKRMRMT